MTKNPHLVAAFIQMNGSYRGGEKERNERRQATLIGSSDTRKSGETIIPMMMRTMISRS